MEFRFLSDKMNAIVFAYGLLIQKIDDFFINRNIKKHTLFCAIRTKNIIKDLLNKKNFIFILYANMILVFICKIVFDVLNILWCYKCILFTHVLDIFHSKGKNWV